MGLQIAKDMQCTVCPKEEVQCISGCLSRRDKKWESALFVQVTTAVFISSRFHSAVVTCTNKANSHFLSLLDKQPEIHCIYMLGNTALLEKNCARVFSLATYWLGVV